MNREMSTQPNGILDLTGLTCTMPLLVAKRVMDDLEL